MHFLVSDMCNEKVFVFYLISQGEMCASPDIFAHLTHLLMNLAGGKLCAVLEVSLDVFILKVADLHSHHISFLEFCSVESPRLLKALLSECFSGWLQLDVPPAVFVSDSPNFAWRSCSSTRRPGRAL